MKRPNLVALQAACDKFNQKFGVGDPVSVLLDSGETIKTVTTSEAQVLSGHTAVIWLSGIRGCYMLDRVKISDRSAAPSAKPAGSGVKS